MIHDLETIGDKLDTIVQFVNGDARDRSQGMWLYQHNNRLLIEYPDLWPDYVFCPFILPKKHPLVEDKIRRFVFDTMERYIDGSNWIYWKSYISSKLVYELHVLDKRHSIINAIWDKPALRECFHDTVNYFLQHKPKKLNVYVELIARCYRVKPAVDPSDYILCLKPLGCKTNEELTHMIQEWRNKVDEFSTQVLDSIVLQHGDKAITHLE